MISRSIVGRFLILAVLVVSLGVIAQAAIIITQGPSRKATAQTGAPSAGTNEAQAADVAPVRVVYPGPDASAPASNVRSAGSAAAPVVPPAVVAETPKPDTHVAALPSAPAPVPAPSTPVPAAPSVAPEQAASVAVVPAPAALASAEPAAPQPVEAPASSTLPPGTSPQPSPAGASLLSPDAAMPAPAASPAPVAATPAPVAASPAPEADTLAAPSMQAPVTTPAAPPASASDTAPAPAAARAATKPKPVEVASIDPAMSLPHASPQGTSASGPGRGIDINRASAAALNHLRGGGMIGQTIVAHRPYRSVEELVARRVLRRSVLDQIRGQIAAR